MGEKEAILGLEYSSQGATGQLGSESSRKNNSFWFLEQEMMRSMWDAVFLWVQWVIDIWSGQQVCLSKLRRQSKKGSQAGWEGGMRGTGKEAVVGEGLPAPLLTQSDPAESNEPRPCENGWEGTKEVGWFPDELILFISTLYYEKFKHTEQ